MVYLLLGQDTQSKDLKLKRLTEEFLPKGLEKFNLDILYAKELNLRDLQEKLLFLPAQSKKRMVLIKQAQYLREDVKKFLLAYAPKAHLEIVLVLDCERQRENDAFLSSLARYATVFRFKEEPAAIDTFTLSRQIEQGQTDFALRLLHQLLKKGERPELILGGLRYAIERNSLERAEAARRIKLLLRCDSDIKTSKLKPLFALERLVVSLCALVQPQH